MFKHASKGDRRHPHVTPLLKTEKTSLMPNSNPQQSLPASSECQNIHTPSIFGQDACLNKLKAIGCESLTLIRDPKNYYQFQDQGEIIETGVKVAKLSSKTSENQLLSSFFSPNHPFFQSPLPALCPHPYNPIPPKNSMPLYILIT